MIDKTLLIETIQKRTASWFDNDAKTALLDLRDELLRDEYDVEPVTDDNSTAEPDPLEAAADRILAGDVDSAVRALPVGEVPVVEAILIRRAQEAEQTRLHAYRGVDQLNKQVQQYLATKLDGAIAEPHFIVGDGESSYRDLEKQRMDKPQPVYGADTTGRTY